MRFRFAKALVGVLALGISTASAGPMPAAQAAATPAQQGLRQPDVIYVPTRQSVVDAMLKVANVKAGDVLYDLGCGDGRIPVTAAKLGARAVCIDIDPRRIAEANENVKKNSVGDRVKSAESGSVYDGHQRGDRCFAVSAAVAEPEAAAHAVENAEARHAHRLARFRHGRLEAGADAERGRRDCLLLDHYAGPGEEAADAK